jgi:hypothetical protein
MTYYDPFLALWNDGPAWQGTVRLSVAFAQVLNSDLTHIYGQAGAPAADVQGGFATLDWTPDASYNGQTVPDNVGRICTLTLMCASLNIHANDGGHAIIAAAFASALDRLLAGGGNGLWLADGTGGVHPLGNAPALGSATLTSGVAALVPTPDHLGYWLVTTPGRVLAFGDAASHGDLTTAGVTTAGVVGMAPTRDGGGYWLVAADGGVFAFGDAGFFGSMGGRPLNRPVVGMAPSPSGLGYWLVAADGGIFAFGDTTFSGSMGAVPLNAPVVALAATPDGNGYWLAAADGGIFAFGDASFLGSMGGRPLNRPVTAFVPTPTGAGYWLAATDGGVFAFGDAPFPGSLVGTVLPRPVTSAAAD